MIRCLAKFSMTSFSRSSISLISLIFLIFYIGKYLGTNKSTHECIAMQYIYVWKYNLSRYILYDRMVFFDKSVTTLNATTAISNSRTTSDITHYYRVFNIYVGVRRYEPPLSTMVWVCEREGRMSWGGVEVKTFRPDEAVNK